MNTSRPSLDNPAERAIGVLIVDDHPIAREGLRRVLEPDPACRVLGEAASGREAITQAQRLRPDVVLLDLSLPDLDGIRVTAIMRRDLPDTEVVVLTEVLTPTAVTQAMQAGAGGYLFKDARPSEICTAIQQAMQRQVHLSAQVTESLVTQFQPSGPPDPLSEREGGGAAVAGCRLLQSRDQEAAPHHRGHRQDPCSPHPGQARGQQPHPGRPGGDSSGLGECALLET